MTCYLIREKLELFFHSRLVPSHKMTGKNVLLRSVNGDAISYPLAWITGSLHYVEAAVANCLPVSVLLVRDLPDLASNLKEDKFHVMVAVTRSQSQRLASQDAELEGCV